MERGGTESVTAALGHGQAARQQRPPRRVCVAYPRGATARRAVARECGAASLQPKAGVKSVEPPNDLCARPELSRPSGAAGVRGQGSPREKG